jgi:hypothetical protein
VISGFSREVDENCALLNVGVCGFSTPEDGTDRLSRNVLGNYHYSMPNNPEFCSSQFYVVQPSVQTTYLALLRVF